MKLKLQRIKKKWTQTDLANASGVGLSTVVKIEKGNVDNVSVAILKKIADALDTTVTELFFTEDDI